MNPYYVLTSFLCLLTVYILYMTHNGMHTTKKEYPFFARDTVMSVNITLHSG
jgi:hypothetical protein